MLKLYSRAFIGAFIALTFGLIGWSNTAHAQLPSSVDIGLYEVTPGMLEVRTTANGASFNEVVSSIVFTIRWETASMASLGTVNQIIGGDFCPLVTTNVAVNPAGVLTDGGFNYQNYTVIGTQQLQGCGAPPGYSWPMGTEVVLAQIPYSGLANGYRSRLSANSLFWECRVYQF